jgi:CheY-like chemotaxis protein
VRRKSPSARRVLVADGDNAVRESVSGVLKKAGYAVATAENPREALRQVQQQKFDLAFLDTWAEPDESLNLIARLRGPESRTKLVIMTSDKSPPGLLRVIREQAFEYLCKPFLAEEAVEIADRALGKDATSPFEVISARPHWVELLAPCTIEAAERIRSFMMSLERDIPEGTRRNVGMALRELLLNAVEWGGQLDPSRKVRIAQIRSSRCCFIESSIPERASASRI